MRETFLEYYTPTDEEFSELWKNATFVLDANVLLNVYRYSPSTRDNLLNVFDSVSARIWVPYQAALEYQKNRLGVIYKQSEAYDKIIDTLKKHEEKLSEELNAFKIHPYINIDNCLERIKTNFEEIKKEIEEKKNVHPELSSSDEFRERITFLLKNKIGEPYDEKKLDDIYKEGEERYKKRIPPGFKDNTKGEEERYGDLVLWYQILDHAKSTKEPIIFVTDDNKEDWWSKFNGKTVSPHRYLIREMINKAKVKFYIYRTEQFMTYANKYLGLNVNDNAIEEIETIRTWDQKKEDLYDHKRFSLPLEKSIYEAYTNKVNRLAGVVSELLSKYSITEDDIELEIFSDMDGTKTIIINYTGNIGVTIIPEEAINELKSLSRKYGIKIEIKEKKKSSQILKYPCPRCNYMISTEDWYCPSCRLFLE